jgi:hypothetical protein
MLGERSIRIAMAGIIFSSFLTCKDGFKLKAMRSERAIRRRMDIRIAFGCPILFRIVQYWMTVKANPRSRRIRVAHKGKTGAMVI